MLSLMHWLITCINNKNTTQMTLTDTRTNTIQMNWLLINKLLLYCTLLYYYINYTIYNVNLQSITTYNHIAYNNEHIQFHTTTYWQTLLRRVKHRITYIVNFQQKTAFKLIVRNSKNVITFLVNTIAPWLNKRPTGAHLVWLVYFINLLYICPIRTI